MRSTKSFILILLTVSLVCFSSIQANKNEKGDRSLSNWEMEIHMCNGTGHDNWGSTVTLDLYKVVAYGSGENDFLLEYLESSTCPNGQDATIEMINTASEDWGGNTFTSRRLGADGTSRYVIVFNGSHYVYFSTGTIGDWYLDYRLNGASYSISICTNHTSGRDSEILNSNINWYPRTLTANNSFSGGTIKVDGHECASGTTFTTYYNTTHSVERIDRQNSTVSGVQYVQVFNNWNGNNNLTDDTYSFTMSGDRNATATFLKECNITFNPSSGVTLSVGGTNYSSSFTIPVREGNTINVNTYNYEENSLLYSPLGWSSGGINYSASFQYAPSLHTTFAFRGGTVIKPTNTYRNQQISASTDGHVQITWSEHPNSNVTKYRIYRHHVGESGFTVIDSAYSGSSTHTYVDNTYYLAEGNKDNFTDYDVRAVYTNGSYIAESDVDYQRVGGELTQPNTVGNSFTNKSISLVPKEYTLGNYPNPFNPTTIIRYALPEAGQVTLKVYNILSQEVASLVDNNQAAGLHQVNFNANNLPTGIYIARLQAGAKVMTTKLQLIK